jgi:hypothetical protein
MTDIFDLAPSSATVEVGETKTVVRPIQLGDCITIVNRFPKLSSFINGNKDEVTFGEILATGAVPAICAAGCGRPNDLDAEAHFASFDADTQTRFLGPILRITMPRGVTPFLMTLGEFAEVLSGPPQPKSMSKEDIARRLVQKNSGSLSPLPSVLTEELSAKGPSGP